MDRPAPVARSTTARERIRACARGVLAVAGALLWMATVPALAFATSSPRLTLSNAVDRSTAPLGTTLTYTVVMGNRGTRAATDVSVDDVLGGTAGYAVNDGTAGTLNSFAGSVVVTVTRVTTGHYRWSYRTVRPGDADVVRFTATIAAPAGAPHSSGLVALTSTASSAGVASVTVTTTASSGQSVKGISTRTPGTGVGPGVALAVFLMLGGLGLILIEQLMRRPEQAGTGDGR